METKSYSSQRSNSHIIINVNVMVQWWIRWISHDNDYRASNRETFLTKVVNVIFFMSI